MSSVTATYLVHDENGSFDKKAEAIALGLTVGTWTDLPELEQKQLEKHKGQVVSVTPLPPDEGADASFGRTMHRGFIQIRYPSANFTADLPAIQATIFGKLSLDGAIKLVDFDWTEDMEKFFPGPKFGIEGIREQLGVLDRPLVMSIFKGMIGKPMNEFSEQLKQQALGGVDLVKDDEILFDNDLMPFMERVQKGKEILQQVYEQSGHRTLYAVHLSGRTFDLLEKAKRAVHAGANALLLNVFAYGVDVLQALVEHPDIRVPIFAHSAIAGATISSPYYGIASSVLLGKWLRLAGADAVLFPSPYGSVAMDRKETEQIALALTSTRPDSRLKRSFPAPSAGIHPGLVPQLVADFGRNSIINAGGGIHGHPEGAAAGGRAFREAVDATMAGISLEQKASESAELRAALDLWGGANIVHERKQSK